MITNEVQLLSQLKLENGNDQVYKILITFYKDRLYWHIRNIVKFHDDADIVLQNTFIKILKNINNFKDNVKPFLWMYSIALNESMLFINQRAKFFNVTNREERQLVINNLVSDIYFKGDKNQLKLQKAIITLPPRQQLVFNMRYFEDLKYKEIADVLKVEEESLKASYHIAVKKIEDYLANN